MNNEILVIFKSEVLLDWRVMTAGNKPAILQPNAGAPREDNGQVVYDATPQGMAVVSGQLLDTGLKIIGGCCDTTPAHLAAMRQAMDRR